MATREEIWRRYDAMEARLSASLSERMLDLAGLRPGMRVLDLASGRGEPAIPAARRVGPSGSVLGVDVAADLLAMAAERAAREGVTNLELRVGDAAELAGVPDAGFDAALCRWGLMFMSSPVAALAAARRALVPGGPLVLAVWAEPERVSWFSLPRRALAKQRGLSPIEPTAPGPFRYADPERLRHDLEQAGFGVEHVEELEVHVVEAETAAELADWARAFGMAPLLAFGPAT
jgi:ubiquinone/menaquinone biosynthesis C-methylase UbiE